MGGTSERVAQQVLLTRALINNIHHNQFGQIGISHEKHTLNQTIIRTELGIFTPPLPFLPRGGARPGCYLNGSQVGGA